MCVNAVHLEPIDTLYGLTRIWVMRAYPEGAQYPEPYTTAGTVIRTGLNTATVKGFVGRVTAAGYKNLLRLLHKEGISILTFERHDATGAVRAQLKRSTACPTTPSSSVDSASSP